MKEAETIFKESDKKFNNLLKNVDKELKTESKLQWLNTKHIVNKEVEKPCVKLQYCPYGCLIEAFPFSSKDNPNGSLKEYSPYSCANVNGAIIQFGHDCPVHYLAEFVEKPKAKTLAKKKVAPKKEKDGWLIEDWV
jgi:hypothetical protein